MVADRREEIGDVMVVQRVAHVTSVAAGAHEAQRAEQAQMV